MWRSRPRSSAGSSGSSARLRSSPSGGHRANTTSATSVTANGRSSLCARKHTGRKLRDERIARPGRLPPHRITGAAGGLNALVSEEPISEALALSTCNRTELYLVATDSVEAETAGLGVLAREAGIPPTELLGPLYSLRDADAARHLYRVTAGLDSTILGEAEIQGQVKRASELATVEGAT